MESIILTPAAWPVTALPCSLSRCPSFTSVLHVSNYSVHTQEALPYSPVRVSTTAPDIPRLPIACHRSLHAYKRLGSGRVTFQQCHFLSACEYFCARPRSKDTDCDEVIDLGLLNTFFLGVDAYECTMECSSWQVGDLESRAATAAPDSVRCASQGFLTEVPPNHMHVQVIHIPLVPSLLPMEPGEITTLTRESNLTVKATEGTEADMNTVAFYTLMVYTIVTMIVAFVAMSAVQKNTPKQDTHDSTYEEYNVHEKFWSNLNQAEPQVATSDGSSCRRRVSGNNQAGGQSIAHELGSFSVPHGRTNTESIELLLDTFDADGNVNRAAPPPYWNIGQVIACRQWLRRVCRLRAQVPPGCTGRAAWVCWDAGKVG
eukprot:448536-Prorocentrum_minimum.AAC.1